MKQSPRIELIREGTGWIVRVIYHPLLKPQEYSFRTLQQAQTVQEMFGSSSTTMH
jgi:hypothetical protein